MTSPDGQLRADLDELASAGSRWDAMTVDLDPGVAPSPGDLLNPTGMAVLAIHGTVKMSTAQLVEMLGDYAAHTSTTAAKTGAQEQMSASSMKDILNTLTSSGKDVMQGVTNAAQVGAQVAGTVGQSGTQMATTAMNAAMTAATTGSHAGGAPGGAAVGLTSPGSLDDLHHDTTTRQGEHHDGPTDPQSPARV